MFNVSLNELRAAAAGNDLNTAKEATLRLERTCLKCDAPINQQGPEFVAVLQSRRRRLGQRQTAAPETGLTRRGQKRFQMTFSWCISLFGVVGWAAVTAIGFTDILQVTKAAPRLQTRFVRERWILQRRTAQ